MQMTKTALRIGLLCLAATTPVWAQGGPQASGGDNAARAGVGNQVTNHAEGIPEGEPGDTQPIPQDESDHMQQAYKDYQARNFPAATKELQDVLKKEPNIVEAHEMLADIYLRQNQVPQAIPELETVVRMHPKDVAQWRGQLGVAYQQTGQFPKAISLYQTAMLRSPKDPTVVYSYAIVLEKSGKHADAAAAFEKAATLDPTSNVNSLYAGLLYHQIGNDTKAVPYLKTALVLGTDQKFNVYTALAEAASTAKQTAEAVKYYTLAGQANPTDFNTQANLGILEQNAGNKAEAEAAYQKAIALKADPKSMASIQSNLAMLLTADGKLDDAATFLIQATQSDPSSVSIQDNLGAVYEKQGKKALALAAYQKALTINPNNGLAKDGVARLGKP